MARQRENYRVASFLQILLRVAALMLSPRGMLVGQYAHRASASQVCTNPNPLPQAKATRPHCPHCDPFLLLRGHPLWGLTGKDTDARSGLSLSPVPAVITAAAPHVVTAPPAQGKRRSRTSQAMERGPENACNCKWILSPASMCGTVIQVMRVLSHGYQGW
jgi:hypothetical protein